MNCASQGMVNNGAGGCMAAAGGKRRASRKAGRKNTMRKNMRKNVVGGKRTKVNRKGRKVAKGTRKSRSSRR